MQSWLIPGKRRSRVAGVAGFVVIAIIASHFILVNEDIRPSLIRWLIEEDMGNFPDVTIDATFPNNLRTTANKTFPKYKDTFIQTISSDPMLQYLESQFRSSITYDCTTELIFNDNITFGNSVCGTIDPTSFSRLTRVIEGRFPNNNSECLMIEKPGDMSYDTPYSIQDQIKIWSFTDELDRYINLTIVGVAHLKINEPGEAREKMLYEPIADILPESLMRTASFITFPSFFQDWIEINNPYLSEVRLMCEGYIDRNQLNFNDLGKASVEFDGLFWRITNTIESSLEESGINIRIRLMESFSRQNDGIIGLDLFQFLLTIPLFVTGFLLANFLLAFSVRHRRDEINLLRVRGISLNHLTRGLLNELVIYAIGGVLLGTLITISITPVEKELIRGEINLFDQSSTQLMEVLIPLVILSLIYALILGFSQINRLKKAAIQETEVFETKISFWQEYYLDITCIALAIFALTFPLINDFLLLLGMRLPLFLMVNAGLLSLLGVILLFFGFFTIQQRLFPYCISKLQIVFDRRFYLWHHATKLIYRNARYYMRSVQVFILLILFITALSTVNQSVEVLEQKKALFETGSHLFVPSSDDDLSKYEDQLNSISGVDAITPITMGQYFFDSGSVSLMGIEPTSYFQAAYLPESLMDPSQSLTALLDRFRETPNGIILHQAVLENVGWNIGTNISLPYTTFEFEETTLNFTIIGSFYAWPRLQQNPGVLDSAIMGITHFSIVQNLTNDFLNPITDFTMGFYMKLSMTYPSAFQCLTIMDQIKAQTTFIPETYTNQMDSTFLATINVLQNFMNLISLFLALISLVSVGIGQFISRDSERGIEQIIGASRQQGFILLLMELALLLGYSLFIGILGGILTGASFLNFYSVTTYGVIQVFYIPSQKIIQYILFMVVGIGIITPVVFWIYSQKQLVEYLRLG